MTTVVSFPGYRDAVVIGRGGLGRVYRALRASTGGPVAIKEMRDVDEDSPAWRQVRRELDAMLRVKGHPYVVSVEEVIETERGPAIVMEFVGGGSLHERYLAGALSPGEFVLAGSQVAQALDAAHGVGVVHRDLKPQNILIGHFGQVKVCDFGIAALNRDGHRTVVQANTPAFASPEELAGATDIGPSADVYSLAATMAHLARGGLETSGTIDCGRELHRFGVLHPSLVPLVDVLQRSLRPHPEARPSMADLVDAFDDASSSLGSSRVRQLTSTWEAPASTDDWDPDDVAATIVRPKASTNGAPAGWYPDPSGRHAQRYWNGSAWTGDIARGGERAVETPGPGSAPGWYADPAGRFDQRWFDGSAYTLRITRSGLVGWETGPDQAPAPVGWYNDPAKRHQLRYWDGQGWTIQVASHGVTSTDDPWGGRPMPAFHPDPVGRHERRYHNGVEWTGEVWTAGARFEESSPNWYPDFSGRHQFRYWDGLRWTNQVSDGGRTSMDDLR